VLAVSRDHRVPAGAAHTTRADELAARLPRRAWQRLSAGEGAKGHRYHDWAWISIPGSHPGHRWLLIRRTPRTGEPGARRPVQDALVPLATTPSVPSPGMPLPAAIPAPVKITIHSRST
jgi:hypothetical protein